jgi:hypothetical protein
MPRNEMFGIVDIICFAFVLLICFTTVWMLKDPKGSSDKHDEHMRLIYNAVLASSVLMWPIVFDLTIGLRQLFENPKLIIGFFWPILISMTELNYVSCFATTTTGKSNKVSAMFQQSDLNADTGAIISAAFAMGSLLLGSRKNPTVNYIIMYALLFCVAFVVPTLQLPPDTKESIMWRAIQKVFLNYAIGFTISGISSDIMIDMFSVKENNNTEQAAFVLAARDGAGGVPASTDSAVRGGGQGQRGGQDSTIRFRVLPDVAATPQDTFSMAPISNTLSTTSTDVPLNLKINE